MSWWPRDSLKNLGTKTWGKKTVLQCTKCTVLVSWTLIHAKVQCLVLELRWIETNLPISIKPTFGTIYPVYHEKLDLPPTFPGLADLPILQGPRGEWRAFPTRWWWFDTPRGELNGGLFHDKSTGLTYGKIYPKAWFYMGLGVFPVEVPFVEFWATRSLGLPNHDGRLAWWGQFKPTCNEGAPCCAYVSQTKSFGPSESNSFAR